MQAGNKRRGQLEIHTQHCNYVRQYILSYTLPSKSAIALTKNSLFLAVLSPS